MNSSFVTAIGDEEFNEKVLKSLKPVLVDFWASYCGPCRQLAPLLENLAEKLQEKLAVVKIDTQVNQGIAMQYKVQALPTLMLFKQGELIYTHVGANLSLTDLENMISERL